jgi:CelD/BcsL family acetyltransferase involved in cellulose biosynthesis
MTSFAASLDFPQIADSVFEPKQAYCIEPLKDPRWDGFLERHPRASMFHSSPWLQALSRTYGYEQIAYTTSRSGQALKNAIVLCRVKSWLTGRRLVSLPFSDHCEPLVDTSEDQDVLTAALEQEVIAERFNYLELRALDTVEVVTPLCKTTVTYAFHQLDLRSNIQTIFSNFHKSSTQRKVHRAAREGLTYREGSAKSLLDVFYRIFTLTRKRQGLAPQSRKWFANLLDCFGDALKIRVALKDERPIAAIITIRYKDTLTYKYGCCDPRFNSLGCMHLLFWNAILEAKSSGLRFLDFGRTDADQQGLITFKSRWGATRSVLTYSRYGTAEKAAHLFDIYSDKRRSRMVKRVLKRIPQAVLPMIGQLVYKHIG